MNTQSQDTTPTNRLEAARQAALGALSRARETLQVAATTVPVWARGVEQKAGEQADALLERVGLVRIAKVAAVRPAEAAPAEPAAEPAAASAEPVAASVEPAAESAATGDDAVDASTAATDEPAVEASAATPAAAEHAGDRSGRKRRR